MKRLFIPAILVVAVLALAGGGYWYSQKVPTQLDEPPANEPLAVIYVGGLVCKDCELPWVDLLTARHYRIQKVHDGESTPELLKSAAIYVAPGSAEEGSSYVGWTESDRTAIRDYVRQGGRYLGVCYGAYLAADWPGNFPDVYEGLTIVPAHVERLGTDESDKVIVINWEGKDRAVYFQDGPAFTITDGEKAKVYARYQDGSVAAFSAPYGRGMVAVSGPHIEATQDWFDEYDLKAPDGLSVDLAGELLDDLLGHLTSDTP